MSPSPPLVLLVGLFWLASSPAHGGNREEASAAFQSGNYPQSLVRWSLVLHEARASQREDQQAEALFFLGLTHFRLHRYQDASASLEEARSLDLGRGDRVGGAAAEQNLGLIDRALGRFSAAEKRFARAVEVFRGAGDVGKAASALLDRGAALLDLGKAKEAEPHLEAALRLFQGMGDKKGEAEAWNNRGAAARQMGRLGQAAEALDRAGSLYRLLGDLPGEAATLTNLGSVEEDRGRMVEAEARYQSARARAREGGSPGSGVRAGLQWAALLMRQGRTSDALKRLSEAEEDASRGDDPRAREEVRLERALLHARAGQGEEALTMLREAVAQARQEKRQGDEAEMRLGLGTLLLQEGPSQEGRQEVIASLALAEARGLLPLMWRGETLLGRESLQAGRQKEGISHLKRAVAKLEEERALLPPSPSAETDFLVDRALPYRLLVDALLADGDAVGAFLHAQKLQAATLEARSTGASSSPGEAGLRELRQRAGSLVDVKKATDPGDQERLLALNAEEAQIRNEFSTFVDGMKAREPDLSRRIRIDPEDLEASQRLLPEGVAVLQPLVLPHAVVVLLFTRAGLHHHRVEVEEGQVNQAVARALRPLREQKISNLQRIQEPLAELHRWLVEPLASPLEGIHTLLWCPSGILQDLPPALLWDGGRWLGERFTLALLPHVGVLETDPPHLPLDLAEGQQLLALADPDGSLPAARKELQALHSLFPRGTYLEGEGADYDALIRHGSEASVLHLATHGMLDPVHPQASFLLLAGEGEQARLRYSDIPGLSASLSQVELVVLSACESARTARGEDEDGQGVEIGGLANQFRRAGIPSLVASLWKVPDDSTRALMEAFYRELGVGTGRAKALQRAQARVRSDSRWSHPFFWGGFIVAGDWE